MRNPSNSITPGPWNQTSGTRNELCCLSIGWKPDVPVYLTGSSVSSALSEGGSEVVSEVSDSTSDSPSEGVSVSEDKSPRSLGVRGFIQRLSEAP